MKQVLTWLNQADNSALTNVIDQASALDRSRRAKPVTPFSPTRSVADLLACPSPTGSRLTVQVREVLQRLPSEDLQQVAAWANSLLKKRRAKALAQAEECGKLRVQVRTETPSPPDRYESGLVSPSELGELVVL